MRTTVTVGFSQRIPIHISRAERRANAIVSGLTARIEIPLREANMILEHDVGFALRMQAHIQEQNRLILSNIGSGQLADIRIPDTNRIILSNSGISETSVELHSSIRSVSVLASDIDESGLQTFATMPAINSASVFESNISEELHDIANITDINNMVLTSSTIDINIASYRTLGDMDADELSVYDAQTLDSIDYITEGEEI